jgi:hypothetical protein
MVRKSLLLKLGLLILLVIDLMLIITPFIGPLAGGWSVGLGIGSFILLPVIVTLLIESTKVKHETKGKIGSYVWISWFVITLLILGVLYILAWWLGQIFD